MGVAFASDGRVAMDNNAAERALRPIGGPESLCTPSLSICKHWKRVRISTATRAALSGYRGLDRRRREVAGPDLIRRTANHLFGGQHLRLDQMAYPMIGHAQSGRSLCHGQPFAVFVGWRLNRNCIRVPSSPRSPRLEQSGYCVQATLQEKFSEAALPRRTSQRTILQAR